VYLIEVKFINRQDPIMGYLDLVKNMSTSTADEYSFRLNNFRDFIRIELNLTIFAVVLTNYYNYINYINYIIFD
jgi:hypothetical protein